LSLLSEIVDIQTSKQTNNNIVLDSPLFCVNSRLKNAANIQLIQPLLHINVE